MKNSKSIKSGISYKEGYKYVWDEQTNFIFFQNSIGHLIFGLVPPGEKVSENEIKKLCELSLKNFEFTTFGSGYDIMFNCKMFARNFYSVVNNKQQKDRVNKLLSYRYERFSSQEEDYEDEIFVIRIDNNLIDEFCYLSSKLSISDICDRPIYWKFDVDDGYTIPIMVANVAIEILSCLYDIGITRKDYDSNNEYVEDINNKELLKKINYFFHTDQFDVVEQREEDINLLYDIAHEENILYDECIKHLEKIIMDVIYLRGSTLLTRPERNWLSYVELYQKITGESYRFYENMQRILQENPSIQKVIQRDIIDFSKL